MMFILKSIVRRAPLEVACTIEQETGELNLVARFMDYAPEIRAIEFIDLPTISMRELSNCDEYRAFVTALFRFQKGEQLSLPMAVVSDLREP